MCHNSVFENEQIDKCIENGMPHKIIKTIKYTLRQRAANGEEQQPQQQQQQQRQNITDLDSSIKFQDQPTMEEKKSNMPKSRCPFGHDRFSTSANMSSSTVLTATPLTAATTTATTTTNNIKNNNFKFPNLNERFHQITQLSRNIATATDNDVSNNITDLSGHYENKVPTGKAYNDDILAKSTQLTKQFTYNMQQAIRRLQSSKIYTFLTRTAQPAHIIVIGIFSFVLLTVWPELIDGTSSAAVEQETQLQQHQLPTNESQDMSTRKNNMLALIAYLGAFATHFGAQIWMTFVSGLSLYFSLPRHMFGQCQQILFPKYFAMNAALSLTMLILFVKFFLKTWTLAKCIQLGSLAVTGVIEVIIRLYLAPPLLRLMHEKYKIEGAIGSGKEVGSLVQGDLVQCPHYQRIHKAFRRIHMTVAIGNIITMVASCLQLYYIASHIQISIA